MKHKFRPNLGASRDRRGGGGGTGRGDGEGGGRRESQTGHRVEKAAASSPHQPPVDESRREQVTSLVQSHKKTLNSISASPLAKEQSHRQTDPGEREEGKERGGPGDGFGVKEGGDQCRREGGEVKGRGGREQGTVKDDSLLTPSNRPDSISSSSSAPRRMMKRRVAPVIVPSRPRKLGTLDKLDKPVSKSPAQPSVPNEVNRDDHLQGTRSDTTHLSPSLSSQDVSHSSSSTHHTPSHPRITSDPTLQVHTHNSLPLSGYSRTQSTDSQRGSMGRGVGLDGGPLSMSRSEEEVRREEEISDTLGEVLERAAREEDVAGGNLSGVVRSSLDLICPPPSRDEGATFVEGLVEERRVPHLCSSEEESQEQCVGDRGGGVAVAGGEGVGEGESGDGEEVRGENSTVNANNSGSRKRPLSCSNSTSDKTAAQKPKRKKAALRSPKLREAPDRASMTMQELIYYNPSANPMSSTVEERRKKSHRNGVDSETDRSQPSSQAPTPPPAGEAVPAAGEGGVGEEVDEGRLVPQLRIGKDGNIVLDEESMVMATTQQPLSFDDPMNPPLIEGSGHTTSASYRKSSRVIKWNRDETTLFFRALSQVGTDFTMMTLLLPKRTRKELKNKFKKEEKNNPHRVSQALKNQTSSRSAPSTETTT